MTLEKRIHTLCQELEKIFRCYGVVTTAHLEEPIQELIRRHIEEAIEENIEYRKKKFNG